MDALIVPLRNNNQKRFPYARFVVQQCSAVPCTMAGPLIPMLATQSLPFAGLLQYSSAAPCTIAGPLVPLPTFQQCYHSLGLQCSCDELCTMAGPEVPLPTTQQSFPVAGLAKQHCRVLHIGGPTKSHAHSPAELAGR